MVKRPRGSAVLVSPCWRPGIWPLFEDQSCNFLCLPLFSAASERLGQMNKTKAIFKMILLYAHPFMPYFFYHQMSTCPHSLDPCHQRFLLYCSILSVCSCAPSLLSFLSSLPFFYSPQHSPIPSALHSFVWTPSSYPQHILCHINESRESKGESMMQGPRSRV